MKMIVFPMFAGDELKKDSAMTVVDYVYFYFKDYHVKRTSSSISKSVMHHCLDQQGKSMDSRLVGEQQAEVCPNVFSHLRLLL